MVELIVNAFIPRREQELDLKSWRVELSLPRKQVVRAPSRSLSLQLQREGETGKRVRKFIKISEFSLLEKTPPPLGDAGSSHVSIDAAFSR